jgi:hypothetical protein
MAITAGILANNGRAESSGPKDSTWQPPWLGEPRLDLKSLYLGTAKTAATIVVPTMGLQ